MCNERLIDANALIESARERGFIIIGAGDNICIDIADIEKAPTIEAKPVIYGTWRLNKDGSGTCSNCRRTRKDVWDFDSYDRYCSSCGAEMRLKTENERKSCSGGQKHERKWLRILQRL